MPDRLREARRWASWNLPTWLRRLMCRAGLHYWRYNVLNFGVHDITIRYCEDAGCGTVADLGYDMKWRNRIGKGFGARRSDA